MFVSAAPRGAFAILGGRTSSSQHSALHLFGKTNICYGERGVEGRGGQKETDDNFISALWVGGVQKWIMRLMEGDRKKEAETGAVVERDQKVVNQQKYIYLLVVNKWIRKKIRKSIHFIIGV